MVFSLIIRCCRIYAMSCYSVGSLFDEFVLVMSWNHKIYSYGYVVDGLKQIEHTAP